MSGNDLHLDAFIDGKGAAVSEAGRLTVAPLNDSPGQSSPAPLLRRRATSSATTMPSAPHCKDVLAVDIAKAALTAKGTDGGRRIPYAGDPDGLIWPENTWDFWVRIAN